MKKIVLSLIAFAAFGSAAAIETLTSPDGQIKLTFDLTPEGAPEYSVTYKGKAIVKPSTLGFTLKDDAPLVDRFKQGKSPTRRPTRPGFPCGAKTTPSPTATTR